jgi:hypothetical protein
MNAISERALRMIVPPKVIKEVMDGEAKALQQKILEARKKGHPLEDACITEVEAAALIEAAQGGLGVTTPEHLLLQDLFVQGVKEAEMYTDAIPELSDDGFYLTGDAERVLMDFFVRHPLSPRKPLETRAVPECAADSEACLTEELKKPFS